jgi:hypothetical protein
VRIGVKQDSMHGMGSRDICMARAREAQPGEAANTASGNRAKLTRPGNTMSASDKEICRVAFVRI